MMNPTTYRATAAQIASTATDVGAKLPKPVLDAYDRARLTSAAAADLAGSSRPLAEALVSAIEAGNNPAEDEGVRSAIAIATLDNRGMVQAVEGIVYERMRAVCADHADEIVTAYAKPFDKAADVLADAYARIGDYPLNNTDEIMRMGRDIAQVWTNARTAVRVVDQCVTGWLGLARFVGSPTVDPRYRVLLLADLDQTIGANADAWTVVRAGHRLSLPTFEEYRARVERLTTRSNARQVVVDQHRSSIAGRPVMTEVSA